MSFLQGLHKALHAFWPALADRRQCALEYAELGKMKRLQADILLRGGVYVVGGLPRDPYHAGLLEGRRQLALEIVRTAGTDPAALQHFALTPIRKEE